jgi:hypothetical protein
MATRKQIAANRRNARKSTGPRSAEGKARSAQNAIKHGLTSRQIVLEDESEAEFQELRRNLHDDLAPESQLETLLVNRIAAQQWRLARIPGIEAELMAALREDLVDGPRGLGEAWRSDAGPYGGALTRLARYEAMLERSVTRLLEQLRRVQAERRRRERELAPPPPREPGARPGAEGDDFWPVGAPAPRLLNAPGGPAGAAAQDALPPPYELPGEGGRSARPGATGYLTTPSRALERPE